MGFKSLADVWADTTTPHGRLLVTMLAGIAEFERELIRARTGEGRMRAKARGVKFGRPSKLTPHQRQEALQRLIAGETQAEIARSYAESGGTKRTGMSCRPPDLRTGLPYSPPDATRNSPKFKSIMEERGHRLSERQPPVLGEGACFIRRSRLANPRNNSPGETGPCRRTLKGSGPNFAKRASRTLGG
jgi:hypothetical protein